jgi:hypothetical protein
LTRRRHPGREQGEQDDRAVNGLDPVVRPTAAGMPPVTQTPILTRSTLMPAALAAFGLPPTA